MSQIKKIKEKNGNCVEKYAFFTDTLTKCQINPGMHELHHKWLVSSRNFNNILYHVKSQKFCL